jgi:hypothetical protein
MNEVRELKQHIDWLQGQVLDGDHIVDRLDELKEHIGAVLDALTCVAEGVDKNTNLMAKAIDQQSVLLRELISTIKQVGGTAAGVPKTAPSAEAFTGQFDELVQKSQKSKPRKPKLRLVETPPPDQDTDPPAP